MNARQWYPWKCISFHPEGTECIPSMCCSALTQIIYGGLIFVALVLTIGAMFTPGWNELKQNIDDAASGLEKNHTLPVLPKQSGILPFSCTMPAHNTNGDDGCKAWWEKQPTWLKVVAVAMGVAVVAQVFAFIWNLVTFFACCCKRWLIQPLIGASLVASITMAVAVILFYVKNKDQIEDYKKIQGYENIDTNQVSYSFYLAIGGLVVSVLSFIAAGITQWFAKKSL
uniref:Clc-like protein n=1 Tax=Panagrellus redivivus TaxID=6233 RepID=A0A7E4VA65_PANRE